MITGGTLEPMSAGAVTLLLQPLLRAGEKIRAIVAEDHAQRRLHVVTQQRCICFDRRRQHIDSQFEVRLVIRAELTQDGIGHRADVECSNGKFIELRTTSGPDARTLGTAIVRACDESLHDVETLVPLETPDPAARQMLASRQARWPLVVSQEEIRARNVSEVLKLLAPMLTSPLLTRRSIESVTLTVQGYDDWPQELWDIPEVRTYLQHLDAQFPYWFLFLDKHDEGLLTIVRSVLPVDFAADKLGERLAGWWMPALRQISDFADLDQDVLDALVARSLSYLRHGPEAVAPPLPELARVVQEPEEEEPEPLEAEAVMGDLSALLPHLPPTGPAGPGEAENDLLVFLWSVLDERGLVRHRSQVEHVRAVASLLALHRLRSLFYEQAFGQGGAEAEPAALVGNHPRAEPFWIGVHAGADSTYDAPLEPTGGRTGTSWAAQALDDLSRNQYDEVVPALRKALGENGLFAALLASRGEGARYPVPESLLEELRSSDLDGDLLEAWEWLGEQGR